MTLRNLLIGLLGALAGALIVMWLAQRASYYWAAEQLASLASSLELTARAQRVQGRIEEAGKSLDAAILIREGLARRTWQDLRWTFNTPWAFALEAMTSPTVPTLDVSKIYGADSISATLRCARSSLAAGAENATAPEKSQLSGKGRDGKCAAFAEAFWEAT